VTTRILVALFTLVCLSACTNIARSLGRGGGCAPIAARYGGDVQNALNALSLKGALGERLRSLVGPPLGTDSLRRRVQWITDDQICKAARATAQIWSAADRYAVFRLGNTYWVRGTSWGGMNAIDDRFERIATFIDQ
jgi:hypothetical protein